MWIRTYFDEGRAVYFLPCPVRFCSPYGLSTPKLESRAIHLALFVRSVFVTLRGLSLC